MESQSGDFEASGSTKAPEQRRSRSRSAHGGHARSRPSSLLHIGAEEPGRLVLSKNRVWLRVASTLLAPSIDRKLANGCSPESSRLLASRAASLVSPRLREPLGQQWSNVLHRARRPPVGRSPRGPLNRGSILACERQIVAISHRLSTLPPASARGIAMAGTVLCDGTGPLYNPRAADRLGSVLERIIAELDTSLRRIG